jgi:cytochrome P450
VFRFAHGDKVIRVDLGDQAISKLEWGLYAFVPSMALLQNLETLVTDPGAPKPEDKPPRAETSESIVKAEFEDDLFRGPRWERLRKEHPSGVERIGSTVMVGAFEPVMQVLMDPGSTYSVSGYGERMRQTLGPNPFGQDNVGSNAGHERAFVGEVKKAIANALSEEQAYATAHGFVRKHLATQLAISEAMGLPAASVDVIDVGMDLIAHLCQEWFGVIYGDGLAEVGGIDPKAKRVRCPGHFLALARNVFSAYPNQTVKGLAALQFPAVKDAVAKWVAAAPTAQSAPVIKAVLNAIDKAPSAKDIGDEERNGTVANVMLGLPATLLGSWGKLLVMLTGSRNLWRLQHELPLQPDRSVTYGDARVLRHALIATMAANPVADGIWRRVAKDHKLQDVEVKTGDVVWLGLGAALGDKRGDLQATEDLLFGGPWQPDADGGAPHACPGRRLATGALLGALAALLAAGQWAPTASPTTLTLKPLP